MPKNQESIINKYLCCLGSRKKEDKEAIELAETQPLNITEDIQSPVERVSSVVVLDNVEETRNEVKTAEIGNDSNNIIIEIKEDINVIEIEEEITKDEEKDWKNIDINFTAELQKEWEDRGFDYEEAKEWIKVGLEPAKADYADWLRKIKYEKRKWWERETTKYQEWVVEQGHDQELRTEYQEYKVWVDIHKDFTGSLGNIYQNHWKKYGFTPTTTQPWIEAELKVRDYELTAYARHRGYQPRQTNKQELDKEYKEWEKSSKPAQEYLDCFYPQAAREQIKELSTFSIFKKIKNLTGKLDCSGFINLKKLSFSNNQLTNLDVSNCFQLEEIECYNNQLTNIILPNNPINLKKLSLSNNNFPDTQDLSFLTGAVNLIEIYLRGNEFTGSLEPLKDLIKLEELNISDNQLTGSLDYLSNLSKLKKLDISNTDLNEVNIDKLPQSLEEIKYSTLERPNCKLTTIVSELEKYKWGRCRNCQQPNTIKGWCKPCFEQELKESSKRLTGQELIEKFIEKQPSGRVKLKWVPYEKFINIQPLAEGGFSKIYKAEWSKFYDHGGNETVVLKSLNSSQNIIFEVLTEIINTKLASSNNSIVICHGISQNPTTKDYVIVMAYIKGGNLRQYLQQEGSMLSLKDKLSKLASIASGLVNIHSQDLVHCDFHLGNILNDSLCPITDLGLSRPVNSQLEEGKIFGVMPYVAPEVLCGQPYTQAADIYSFGMVAYEVLSVSPPYPNRKYDNSLALDICQGLRPQFQIKIPQLLEDLIKRCWDVNPLQRPTARELSGILHDWYLNRGEYAEFNQQIKETEVFNQTLPAEIRSSKYKLHPGAVMHSKLINTKQITELINLSTVDLDSSEIDLDLDQLDIISEECEPAAQIQIPPK